MTMEVIDYRTGEYLGDIVPDRYDRATLKEKYCPDAVRINRFRMLNAVRDICPTHRTANCLRFPRSEGGYTSDGLPRMADVEVWRGSDSGKCHYKNLTVCGRVWTCPVCTAKINEGRRDELKRICKAHERAGGTILMITKTFSHTRFDDLSEMISGLSKANDRFWRCADIKRLRESLGLVGYVRSAELTWGDKSGWHPHYHELWFIRGKHDLEAVKKLVFTKWRHFIEKVGLGSPNEDYGVDVRGASDAWDYVVKFGSESEWDHTDELTKHHVKKAKPGRFTPFSLLRVYLGDHSEFAGAPSVAMAKKLFQEYAKVMHGKRQLQYSIGLKSEYEIEDLDDQEMAEKVREESAHLASIDNASWSKILWSDKRENSRALVLSFAQKDLDVMWSYINGLPDPPATYFKKEFYK